MLINRAKINIILVLVFLCSCVLVLSSCAKREIKNINAKGTNIICFGDSLTFGYGANAGEDYPSVLAKLINAPVINAGVDADTTPEAMMRFKTDVLDKEPLLVIIEFAGNDFLKQIPKEVTLNNIKLMTEQIQSRGAMVAIVDISAGMFFSEYRKAFSELAREKRAIFIPHILSGIITNPSMKSDFLHPNADGYKMIAQRIYGVITPYLLRRESLMKSR